MAIGRDMVAQLVLRLRDGVSAGIGDITRRMDRLNAVSRRLATGGALLGGLSVAGPLRAAATMEGAFRNMAVTAGRTGGEVAAMVDRMRGRLNELATARRLSTEGLRQGLEVMSGRGLEEGKLDSFLGVLAEMKSASDTAEDALGSLFVAYVRMAGIDTSEGIRKANASLLRLGQLGGVEPKDSAQYAPGLLAQLTPLGMRGQDAVVFQGAAMQVLRDSFQSTSEAAAGFQALLGQLLSKDLVDKAAERGFDLPGMFKDGERRRMGGDPKHALGGVGALLAAVGTMYERDQSGMSHTRLTNSAPSAGTDSR